MNRVGAGEDTEKSRGELQLCGYVTTTIQLCKNFPVQPLLQGEDTHTPVGNPLPMLCKEAQLILPE